MDLTETERILRTRIIGQNEAIQTIVDTLTIANAGLARDVGPLANFLLLGPTGTGKTHTVETVALAIHGSKKKLLKVDCAEFQHSHEIAKLIGSPPGYLGHRETAAILSEERLTKLGKPAILLFDEIEKSSDALWALLLGIMDKGIVTLGNNQQVDFSGSLLFLTSNVGSREIANVQRGMGFMPVTSHYRASAIDAARRKFMPEFVNRLDRMVVYNHLSQEMLDRVLDFMLEETKKRVFAVTEGRVRLSVTAELRQKILAEGYDARYGARPLRRTIERLVALPVARVLPKPETAYKEPRGLTVGLEGATWSLAARF